MQQTELAESLDERGPSVSRRARWFVVLACVAILMVHAWQSWRAHNEILVEARDDTSHMAATLAQHAYDVFQSADALLLDVSDRIDTLGIDSPLVTKMAPMLRRLAEEMPLLDGILVFDERGDVVVQGVINTAYRIATQNEAKPGAKLNYSDRAYFALHRDDPSLEPMISPVLRSRSTGNWIIPMSRRLNHKDGTFAGMVVAILNLDYVTRIYSSVDVGNNGAIALLLRNGTLLSRKPFDEAYINRDLSKLALFRQMTPTSVQGNADIVSSVDGVHRMSGYHAVQKYPLLVAVALSQDEALADWRRTTLLYSSGVLLLLAMIGSFGWHLIGQIERRLAAEQRALRARDELEELNSMLEKQAHQDGLTGLSNRRHFDEMLEKEYRRSTRGSGPLSLVLIDVDFFKQYNDIYGHQAGDECLREVGRVLQGLHRRPGDLAVRYGGEEMLMLLPNTDSAGAAVMAERIRAGIQALGIAHSANPVGVVTVSAGVNTMEPNEQQAPPMEQLVGQADAALYQAKHGGRNQVRIAGPDTETG